jgi:hypothetical protein
MKNFSIRLINVLKYKKYKQIQNNELTNVKEPRLWYKLLRKYKIL